MPKKATNKSSGGGETITRSFKIITQLTFTSPSVSTSSNVFNTFTADDSFQQMADSYRYYRCKKLRLTMGGANGFGATQALVWHAIGWIPNGVSVPATINVLTEPYFALGSSSSFHNEMAHVEVSEKELMGAVPWLATADDASDNFTDQVGQIVYLRLGITSTLSYLTILEGTFEFRGRVDAGDITTADQLLARAERILSRQGKSLAVLDAPDTGDGSDVVQPSPACPLPTEKEAELLQQIASIPVVQRLLKNRGLSFS